ncbi:mechanosensitive ion channel family protein [Yersinia enterocolitica]|nr:mechanosensitive ion channel family protein [Yersinia enterocolitica]EKN4926217.1 mechanosensitive ion channel family protein [Yersinia enterocolitica]EKN5011509.1 mechanosensitive ion channel family protein [Yersinia enterocolitica]EKN5057478.1 mechanosensitive ion channel family protein [Yersinia enterocolitica]
MCHNKYQVSIPTQINGLIVVFTFGLTGFMKKNEHVVSLRHYPLFCLLFTLICASLTVMSTTGTVLAATTSETTTENDEEPAKPAVSVQLISLQKQLDKLKQNVSVSTSDNQLNALNETAIALVKDVEILLAELKPKREQLQTQLDVLGPPPAAGTLTETQIVAQQRRALNTRKIQLEGQHDQALSIKANAENLETQIIALRRTALKSQIALNSGSILGAKFWAPIINPNADDDKRLKDFVQELTDAWNAAWQPEWRTGTAIYLLLALLIGALGFKLLDKLTGWFCTKSLPQGPLRRSFMASATTLYTVLITVTIAQCIIQAFTRTPDVSQVVMDFALAFIQLMFFSALVAGLGRAFLSNQRPSWRLPAIADEVATSLKLFPPLLASCIMIFGAIDQMNNMINISVSGTIFGNGISALLVALTAAIIPLRANRIRRNLVVNGEKPEAYSTLAGLIHLAIGITAIAILLSLLVGYIALAKFLSYKLVWVCLVLSCLYLLTHLCVDLAESLFSPTSSAGKAIKQTLNIDDRHLAQVATLLSATSKVTLILLAIIALFNGTFGSTTPVSLLQKTVELLGGEGLEKLNIVPTNLFNAALCLLIGLYALNVARRWLSNEFLPKTQMDTGIKTSAVTLFSNIGYVLVILLTLSVLGIQWNKLAWIVSALSVGIGFGLQEIVKNFISGIILLTERPVKVGDLISISGVEGDIRRINVRATEIQLSDRSTVIVPNSQLISQNVRNATMANAQGVVTIALTFPLDLDVELAQELLIAAYEEHESILDTPTPSVKFSQLSPDGIVLSVTGLVPSPRMVSNTKSELLFSILKRLRAAGVSLEMAVPLRTLPTAN